MIYFNQFILIKTKKVDKFTYPLKPNNNKSNIVCNIILNINENIYSKKSNNTNTVKNHIWKKTNNFEQKPF